MVWAGLGELHMKSFSQGSPSSLGSGASLQGQQAQMSQHHIIQKVKGLVSIPSGLLILLGHAPGHMHAPGISAARAWPEAHISL